MLYSIQAEFTLDNKVIGGKNNKLSNMYKHREPKAPYQLGLINLNSMINLNYLGIFNH